MYLQVNVIHTWEKLFLIIAMGRADHVIVIGSPRLLF